MFQKNKVFRYIWLKNNNFNVIRKFYIKSKMINNSIKLFPAVTLTSKRAVLGVNQFEHIRTISRMNPNITTVSRVYIIIDWNRYFYEQSLFYFRNLWSYNIYLIWENPNFTIQPCDWIERHRVISVFYLNKSRWLEFQESHCTGA